jgi:hypothetical protein
LAGWWCSSSFSTSWVTRPNAIAPAHTLTAFVFAVVAGARRFAHTELLRADRALHTLLGLERFPGHDTIRGLFLRFTQADIETFWRPLWRWLLGWVQPLVAGFTLDLDSTIFQRAGQQQGAKKGYNPRRPGRRSHHPLLAVLATFNLLSLFQQASGAGAYRQPATLRAQVFLCGAVLGRQGHQPVLYLSLSWGGLETRKPLREAILRWQKPTAEKLDYGASILSLST